MNFEKKELDNGLRILSVPMKETKATTILITAAVGSRYEDESVNGISHFLEHLFFKGTKKRPTAAEISHELDSIGANYNAFTSEEMTGFFIQSAADKFLQSLDILVDILYNSRFPKPEVEREKGVIIEEINMYKDNPMLYLGELSKEVLYPDQPLGWPVSGKKEAVANLNQQKLIEFRTKHYTPGNMIISIAGAKNLDWETEVKKHMHQKAGKLSKGFERAEVFQQKPRMLLHSRKTDQAHLFIGVKTFPRIDKRRPILKMINGILGGMMSSRIFYQIREKRGLAYYVSSEIDEYIDAGNFGVSTGIKVGKIQEVIEIILNEFDKIRKKKVPKGELDKAKENYKGKMYLGLEDSLSVASFATEQEIFWGEIKKPEQIVEEIEKVTPDDIIKLAGEIFISERLNLALIGPYKDENKFQKLLEI